MSVTVLADARDHESERPPGLFLRRVNGQEAPILTNVGERGKKRNRKPGSGLINTAAILLFLLGVGLLGVSLAAQYTYLLHERHQHIPSMVEASALDLGLVIFSLLALGLARAGRSAVVERALVVACACGSALMNYAASDVTSLRSVLAYVMPPIFLAIVTDRVVVTIRRHVLGMKEGKSPWSALTNAVLYAARFVIAPMSTVAGARRALLNRTPVPEATKLVKPQPVTVVEVRELPWPPRTVGPIAPIKRPELPKSERPKRPAIKQGPKATSRAPRTGTKTSDLLRIAQERHGELSVIPLDQCSKIATAIAAEIGMHGGSARKALLNAARAARNGGAK